MLLTGKFCSSFKMFSFNSIFIFSLSFLLLFLFPVSLNPNSLINVTLIPTSSLLFTDQCYRGFRLSVPKCGVWEPRHQQSLRCTSPRSQRVEAAEVEGTMLRSECSRTRLIAPRQRRRCRKMKPGRGTWRMEH